MTSKLELIIRHGAYGIIVKNSRILLAQKKSGPYCGLWGLPGGMIEYGETPEHTVIRELQEEAAIKAEQLELYEITTATGEHVKNGQACGFHHVGILYKIGNWVEVPHLIPEEKLRWVDLQNVILEELTPFARYVVAKLGTWRPLKNIRAKSIGLALHNHRLLVCEVLDDDGELKGWCPLGGGMEFGETAEAALRREIKEELGCEIRVLGHPLVDESIFTHHGITGHEIVFAFPVVFDNPEIYTRTRWQIFEHRGTAHWVEWIDIAHFLSGKCRIFPEALVKEWMEHSN